MEITSFGAIDKKHPVAVVIQTTDTDPLNPFTTIDIEPIERYIPIQVSEIANYKDIIYVAEDTWMRLYNDLFLQPKQRIALSVMDNLMALTMAGSITH